MKWGLAMKIAIIDDDLEFLNYFQKKVKAYSKKIFDDVDIDKYSDVNSINFKDYRIYFLDIDLIHYNGIEVAKMIKENNKYANIIFITSRNDLVFSAISVQPFYFIRKNNLDRDISVAFTLLKNHYIEKDIYKLKYNSENIDILIDDIIYLETNDHLTTIYTTTKQYHVYKTLKDTLSEINSKYLIQISRKNSVNMMHIINTRKNIVMLDNDIEIKIGNTYKKIFDNALKQVLV